MDPRSQPVHFTSLKRFASSPAHYLHGITSRFVPTKPMRIGTLTHHGVLGVTHDDEDNPIAFYDGERRGNAWKDFKAANDEAEIFTSGEVEEAKPIVDAVLADPVARQFCKGEHERRIAWKFAGRDVSSRLDIIGSTEAGPFVADLKTCASSNPRKFMKQAFDMGYHAQLAFYQDAARSIGIEPVDAYLVAVETKAPYPVTVFRLSQRLLEEGRRTYRAWFERLLVCEATNDWPGYALSCVEFDVPAWMSGAFDDDEDESEEAAE